MDKRDKSDADGNGAEDWPVRLAAGARIAERVAIVVAHPDDETLFAGSLLNRLDDGVVIHLTDGAPGDMIDARRLGFATRDAYASARAAELDMALDRLGFGGERRAYGIRDKEAVHHLDAIVAQLTADLAGAALVLTHPYEGGHPDHDAAACAVARAVTALGLHAPAHGEFPSYCWHAGERRFGRFWSDAASPDVTRAFTQADAARVEAALAAHVSQVDCFGSWRPTHEYWRAAPAYDFSRRPPPDVALYDRFGWDITAVGWRAAANGWARAATFGPDRDERCLRCDG